MVKLLSFSFIRVKCYRLETAPQIDNGWRSISFFFPFSRRSPFGLCSQFIRGENRARAAAVLIGVRGKQIVLLEWDGMEWNDYAEVSS